MQKLVTSGQIKDFESKLIKKNNSDYSLTLMEKAGLGLADVVKEFKEPYLIVCGRGNNGGDGITCAKYLHKAGKKVFLCLTSDENSLSRESKINFDLVKNIIQSFKIKNEEDKIFKEALNSANTVVDCLLGTGSNIKKPSFLFDWIIKTINESAKNIIACDIPTGLDPDTGSVQKYTVKADVTVTFAFPKLGLTVYPGKNYAGQIKTVDIGLGEIETNLFFLDDQFIKEQFPQRPIDSNKAKFGKSLLVCGSERYPGAALLASKAAAIIGSGLTFLATDENVFSQITKDIPEVIHTKFDTNEILKESSRVSSIVIGPGLGRGEEVKKLVENLITKVDIPVVLDADGINAISGNKEILKKAKNHIVITPHEKEFARLLEIKDADDIINNKITYARKTALELGCTVVLKGPGTIIATKEEKIYISPFANSALAKGGTGDVLSGFIGGLIAQGLEPSIAACVGVYIHGKTAELIASDKTVYSLLPQDLISYLPSAIKTLLI